MQTQRPSGNPTAFLFALHKMRLVRDRGKESAYAHGGKSNDYRDGTEQ